MTTSEFFNALLPTGLGVLVALIVWCYRLSLSLPALEFRHELIAALLSSAAIGLGAYTMGQSPKQIEIAMIAAITVALGKNSRASLPHWRTPKDPAP
jgi:hypothetical protein